MSRALPTRRPSRADAGLSAIELIVASALLGIIMAAAYGNLVSQLRVYATEQLVSESVGDARTAMRIMADQIAMAGFGVPAAAPPAQAPRLVTAAPTRIAFWARIDAAHTFLAAGAGAGSGSLSVVSTAGIPRGSAVYVSDASGWHFSTVRAVAGNQLYLMTPLASAFRAGALVTPVEQVTFELVGTELRRNGRRLIGEVTGLAFAYDQPRLADVREITITLTVQTRAPGLLARRRLPFTLTTRVTPPNLGLS